MTTLDPRLYATVPPAEAIAYLRDKVDIPTDGWHEFPDYYQDAAFTVAGAKGALLSQIHNAVNRAISEGQTLAEFSKRFRQIAEGWVGNKPRRAQIIYQTNIRMAYAAGRYAHQLDPAVLKVQPYLQYVHSDAQVPRPHHKALDGKVFRATEIPFAVPNGFGCGCRYVSLTEEEVAAEGLEISNLKRGDLIDTEQGKMALEPDKGFDYIPGRTSPETRYNLLLEAASKMPPAIADYVRQQANQILQRGKTDGTD